MKNPFKTSNIFFVSREFEDEEEFERYCKKKHPFEHLSYFTIKNEGKKPEKNAEPKTAWLRFKDFLKELFGE